MKKLITILFLSFSVLLSSNAQTINMDTIPTKKIGKLELQTIAQATIATSALIVTKMRFGGRIAETPYTEAALIVVMTTIIWEYRKKKGITQE